MAADTLLISDSFTDDNGTDLEAHTPDVDAVGGGWSDYSPDADPLDANIQGNKARLQDNGDGQTRDCVIDCGRSDGIKITGQFTLNSINGGWGGFTYWHEGASGRGIARTQDESNLVIIFKKGGGDEQDTLAMSPGDTLAYELTVEGTTITFKVENLTAGGEVTVTATDTGDPTSIVGLSMRTAFGAGASDFFEDFLVEAV